MTSHFQDSWFHDERYKGWIRKKDATTAMCAYCFNKPIRLESMGESALTSHAKGKRHLERCPVQEGAIIKSAVSIVNVISNLSSTITTVAVSATSSTATVSATLSTSATTTAVSPMETVSSISSVVPVHGGGQTRIDSSLVREKVLYAEMRWVLHVVMQKLSFRSCDYVGDLFKAMFPNCPEAEMFSLKKTKCAYMVNHGFAPYFLELLLKNITKSPLYSLSFDESLNRVLQNGQMDVNVRFWNVDEGKAETRYFTSEFLGQAKAEDILESYLKATEKLDQSKVLQVGSDGPNVNLLFLELLHQKRSILELKPTVNTGTCGLHTVHGSLKAAVKNSGWELGKVLKAMFHLLHDFPSRQAKYVKLTETSVMPMTYCGHRWCENEGACQRAALIWMDYTKYINYCLTLCKSKQPQGKRFECLVKWRNDPIMPEKFKFVEFVAMKLNTFLSWFQTDKPMMPFLYDVLKDIVDSFMKMYIKKEICDSNDTLQKMLNLDLSDVNIRKKIPDVGVGAKLLLNEYKKSKNFNEGVLKSFYKEASLFLASLVQHMLEKSPLRRQVVRCASALNPNLMTDKDEQEACVIKFSTLVTKLAELNQITDQVANKANDEYRKFLDDVVSRNRDEFKEFDKYKDRVDLFLHRFMSSNDRFNNVFLVCQIICILFHGQAHIERGFKTNKDLLRENLEGFSLINLRIVHEHMKVNGYQPHNLPFSAELLKNIRSSHSRYRLHQDEKTTAKQLNSRELKRKIVCDELAEVRKKKAFYEEVIKQNVKDADKISLEAEEKQDFTLLSQSNTLRVANAEKEKLICELKKIEAELISRRESIL